MKKILFNLFFYSTFFILFSCSNKIFLTNNVDYKLLKIEDTSIINDTTFDNFLSFYKNKVDSQMNVYLANNPKDLFKNRNNCTLGFWIADAMKWYCDSIISEKVDIAIINFGGIRSQKIEKGDIYLKNIFEIMPFDNALTIIKVDSTEFKEFFQSISKQKGWPVSYNTKIYIDSNFNLSKYEIDNHNQKDSIVMVISDYIANGGDNISQFKNYNKKFLNHSIRESLIEYAKHQKDISIPNENRIIYNKTLKSDW